MNKVTKIAAASALGLIVSTGALADTFQARVTVVDALSITEDTQINFGNVTPEASTCAMASGGAVSGTNSICTLGDTETPGSFTITGTDATIVLSTTASTSTNGIVYTPTVDGSSTPAISGGSVTVTLIGSLALDGTSTAGVTDIDYDLSANYQ